MPSSREDFPPDPNSARAVRLFVAESLPGLVRLDDVVLAASELAANAIRHARTPFRVEVTNRGGRIRLEVWDSSSDLPALPNPNDSKRGLQLIDAMAEEWGVDRVASGKVVWAEFLTE